MNFLLTICLNFDSSHPIRSQFCTCHGSWHVQNCDLVGWLYFMFFVCTDSAIVTFTILGSQAHEWFVCNEFLVPEVWPENTLEARDLPGVVCLFRPSNLYIMLLFWKYSNRIFPVVVIVFRNQLKCMIYGWNYGMHMPFITSHCWATSMPLKLPWKIWVRLTRNEPHQNSRMGYTPYSWHGNASHITGPLCGESTGHQWIPVISDQRFGDFMFHLLLAGTNCWTNTWFNVDFRCHVASLSYHVKSGLISGITSHQHLAVWFHLPLTVCSKDNQANNKENIKAAHYCPLVWGNH